jgi:outer membrane protein assembly factor BamB
VFRRPRNPSLLAAALAGWCLLVSPCFAQPGPTAGSLQDAAYKAGAGRWADAIEQYQRILETAGDDLVPVLPPVAPLAELAGGAAYGLPWTGDHSVPARWVCHEAISRFPPAALKQYRDRIDPAAAKRLAEAQTRPDDRALEAVLAEWFCSTPAEEAIILLARRAFDRADFDTADRYWRMLLPRPGGAEPRYPEPKTPAATIEAQLLLLRLFRGETSQARHDLKTFRARHPDAAGLLAGHEGKYADTLEALLKDPKQVTVAPAVGDPRIWPTFAGDAERDSNWTGPLPRYWPGPPTWRAALPGDAVPPAREERNAADHPRALAFFPVIAHGRAFVADATSVHAYDLLTGERSTLYDLGQIADVPGIDNRLPVRGEAHFTLTAADGFLYARLGAQALRPPREEREGATPESYSAIVCLPAAKDRKAGALWVLRPPPAKDGTTIFEGAPLVRGDRLYAAVWRQSGGDPVLSIACYRGAGRVGPPELLWQREAGKPAFNPAAAPRTRHDLLTFAGPNVVFGTHAGSVVALDARTGRPAWEHRYARSERRPVPTGRDLAPCLAAGGRVFAAPADASRLLCLDAFSGRRLWEIEGVDVAQLLGVARGRLICTFAGPVKGIRGIDVASGAETAPAGWTQHDDGGVATFGRGFVSPDLVFWPTRQGLYLLDPEDGSPARQPVPGALGNLCYADGCFVVTTATEILGFVSEGKLIEPRKREAEGEPGRKLLLYRLGRSEADRGQVDEAIGRLREVAGAKAEPGTEDALAVDQARAESGLLAFQRAERLQRSGDVTAARSAYREVTTTAGEPLHACGRLRLVELAGAGDMPPLALENDLLVNVGGHPRLISQEIERLSGHAGPEVRGEPASEESPEEALSGTPPFRKVWHVPFPRSRFYPVAGAEKDAAVWLTGMNEVARLPLGEDRLQTLPAEGDFRCAFAAGGRLIFAGPEGVFSAPETLAKRGWSWRLAHTTAPRRCASPTSFPPAG